VTELSVVSDRFLAETHLLFNISLTVFKGGTFMDGTGYETSLTDLITQKFSLLCLASPAFTAKVLAVPT